MVDLKTLRTLDLNAVNKKLSILKSQDSLSSDEIVEYNLLTVRHDRLIVGGV